MSGVGDDVLGLATLAVVSCLAAAVNSVAGGGTILTFPALTAILPPDPARMVVANATSTIGLWPGALAAAWAYRGERTNQPPWARHLLMPSVAGAILGVALVLVLPPQWFAAAVPWLILMAAILFAMQPWIVRMANKHLRPTGEVAPRSTGETAPGVPLLASVLHFLVAVYGGYFGAGIGILMLAVLGLLGLGDIHRLNAVKNVLGTVINGAAAASFAIGSFVGSHDVSWKHAAVMAVAAAIGGLGGSWLARRMPAAVVRRGVAIIAFVLAGYYFLG
jgi:uncharacterized membrane protein YfcA